MVVPALAAEEPWYVEDEKLMTEFFTKLETLAKEDKCLKSEDLTKKLATRTCKVSLAKPGDRKMDPEAVYEHVLDSVFVIGSVEQSEKDDKHWAEGRLASAFAIGEDGLLVTNSHVFDDLKKERFGAANRKGEVFPLVDLLASNPDTDVAIVRVAAKGLRPLALAGDAKVGSWVGVLSHPGDQMFTFTQGHVSRYTKWSDGDKSSRWMSITADFAYGSSGAPVLNNRGAVVGLATITTNIDYPAADVSEPAKDKRPEAAPPPADLGSPAQMVVKLAVPARDILKVCEGEK
jgi:serine protease Do